VSCLSAVRVRRAADFDWAPGDAVAIMCPNEAEEVDTLLHRLGADPEAEVVLLQKKLKKPVKASKYAHFSRTFHAALPLRTLGIVN